MPWSQAGHRRSRASDARLAGFLRQHGAVQDAAGRGADARRGRSRGARPSCWSPRASARISPGSSARWRRRATRPKGRRVRLRRRRGDDDRRAQRLSRSGADRHDGIDAAVERRDLRHRSARQGGVEGSCAASVSRRRRHRRSLLERLDRLGQRGPAGAARARDHVGGVRRLRRDQHRRLQLRASSGSSAISITTTCSGSIRWIRKGRATGRST